MPFFCVVRFQAAADHTVSGVRVSWKIVSAVVDVRFEQTEQIQRPSPMHQPPAGEQSGHTKPSGHLSQSK